MEFRGFAPSGVMEYWSDGFKGKNNSSDLLLFSITSVLHHST
jgi:hypothetical protein